MKFRVISISRPPSRTQSVRVVEQTTGRGVGWINRYLDREYVRRLANTTLCSYAHSLLHFVRWWESVHHTGDIARRPTESTLLDYVRFQSSQQPRLPPPPSTTAWPSPIAPSATSFPMLPVRSPPAFISVYLQRKPMGIGRPRFDSSRLRVKEPKLTIVPLQWTKWRASGPASAPRAIWPSSA